MLIMKYKFSIFFIFLTPTKRNGGVDQFKAQILLLPNLLRLFKYKEALQII